MNCYEENETIDYEKEAQDFLTLTGTKFSFRMLTPKCPKWGANALGESRMICKSCKQVHGHRYRITLRRDGETFSTDFWDSYKNMKDGKQSLTAYDALACLNYEWDMDFNTFCDNYGYDNDSIKAHELWKMTEKDNRKLAAMFSPDELAQLNDIQ